MKSLLTISTIGSLILLCFLAIIWPVSYHLDLCKGLGSSKPIPSDSVPLISNYRVGFENGAVWLYNYEVPWMGGIWGLSNARHTHWGWYWNHYGFSHDIDFEGENKIAVSDRDCDLPGIYFRQFWTPGHDPAYTTLSASLWYPFLLSRISPMLWIFRHLRLRKNRN